MREEDCDRSDSALQWILTRPRSGEKLHEGMVRGEERELGQRSGAE